MLCMVYPASMDRFHQMKLFPTNAALTHPGPKLKYLLFSCTGFPFVWLLKRSEKTLTMMTKEDPRHLLRSDI